MKQETRSIVLLIVLVFIVIIFTSANLKLLMRLLNIKKQYLFQEEGKNINNEEVEEYYNNIDIKEVDNYYTYYKVKNCVQTYFDRMHDLWCDDESNDEIRTAPEHYMVENFYYILADDYINEANLSINKLTEVYNEPFIQKVSLINKMYEYNISENISMYYVQGYTYCTDGSNELEYKVVVLVDKDEDSYVIYPEEYLKKYDINETQLQTSVKRFEKINYIENTGINQIEVFTFNDKAIIEDLFNTFSFAAKYNQKLSFNMLDKEYREKKFDSLKDYSEYLSNNKRRFMNTLNSYAIDKKDGNSRYICKDTQGYFYIFNLKEEGVDYNLILDTYTLDIPEFIEKYDSTNVKGKAALNTSKFMDALNDRDYKYAYSCLAEQFKENKFKTLDSFKEYIEENLFEKNTFEITEFTHEGDMYIFTIDVNDRTQYNEKTETLQVIMQLKEERGFELSFNIK